MEGKETWSVANGSLCQLGKFLAYGSLWTMAHRRDKDCNCDANLESAEVEIESGWPLNHYQMMNKPRIVIEEVHWQLYYVAIIIVEFRVLMDCVFYLHSMLNLTKFPFEMQCNIEIVRKVNGASEQQQR